MVLLLEAARQLLRIGAALKMLMTLGAWHWKIFDVTRR